MKRIITALTLTATTAAAAPAFAQSALDGTVISTMGDRSVVALHERERGIGNNGIVQADNGFAVRVDASRIYDPRDAGKIDSAERKVTRFESTESAVTPYGAR